MTMKKNSLRRVCTQTVTILITLAALLGQSGSAAVPPVEKLLPPDTLLVLSTPDWTKLREVSKKSPQSQLWDDPAMKPFRDKFMAKWNEELVKPLERDLGVNFDDYGALLQGQITFAVLQEGWQGKAEDDGVPAVVVLLDAKEKSDLLKKNLTELRKKWREAGKAIRTEKIRDVEFSVVPLTTNDIPKTLRQIFPQPQDVEELGKETAKKSADELFIGQHESLLLVGSSVKALEKILVRYAPGNSAPTLGEQSEFESCRQVLFREAPFIGWFNTRIVIEVATKMLANSQNPDAPSPIPLPDFGKIFTASGLGGLKSMAFSFRDTGDGRMGEFFLSAPESTRAGLVKLLALEAKETTPPAFVPADAVKFSRFRLDGQKAIATLEKMVTDVYPDALSTWNFVLNNANESARLDDPEFDIRKNIFGNLGDDMVTYEKAPRGKNLADLATAPSLFLLGSPNAEKLAASLKGMFVILSPQAGTPKTREFLGRKIYSFPLPGMVRGAGEERSLSYAASSGYVAFSTDDGILEEFLRSAESQGKTLRDKSGLAEAVAKVGGSGSGWLAYENEAETMRVVMEALARSVVSTNKSEFADVLASTIPFAPPEKKIKEWVDFSLLPSFDKVAKYFGFGVSAGSTSVNGITIRYYMPTPPELLKK